MQRTYRTPSAFEAYATTTYRILLDCLARPGQIGHIPDPSEVVRTMPALDTDAPNPNGFVLASCMTLLDQETSLVQLWRGTPLLLQHPLVEWTRIRTNHANAPLPQSMFAVIWDETSYPALHQLQRGSLTFPEHGATAFIAVDELTHAHTTWILSGPGIRDTQALGIHPDTSALGHILCQARTDYPLGIDVFLIDRHGNCVGIPRSTTITVS